MKKIAIYLFALTVISGCAGSKKNDKDLFEGATVLDQVNVFAYDYKKTYNASEPLAWDLMHTRLELEPDWEAQYLYGKAILVLEPHFYPQSTLIIDAKGMDINEVALYEYDDLFTLDYRYDGLELEISLEDTILPGTQINIFIDYVAKPNELVANYSEAISSDIGLYFINPLGEDTVKPTQLWTQGEPEASSCWFPTIDQPNAKSSSDILITVDTQYVTLSNGVLIGDTTMPNGKRTDHWMMSQPHAPYLFALAVGEFIVTKDTWRGIDVTYYQEPEFAPYARDIFGNTPEMLDFYSEIFGVDYPWDKYAQVVVRDFVSGAMENTTATIHFEGLNQTPREMLDGDREDIIAHELVHHWFGDLVTCESWANLPLNESFATYGEYLWIDYKYGRSEADLHLARDLGAYLSEAERKQVDLIRYDYESPNDMFDRHSYQKGGLVLHYLRNIVGDEAFFESLRVYLNEQAFGAAEIDHLRLAFEEVTGEDMHWFFNQWFLNSGHPVLEMDADWEGNSQVQSLILSQEASNNSGYVFRLPMDVDFYFMDTIIRRNVVLNKPSDTFTYIFDSEPIAIVPDAGNYVLAELDEGQDLAAYGVVYDRSPLAAQRLWALGKLADNQEKSPIAARVVVLACDDDFHYIRRRAVDALEESNDFDNDHNAMLMRLAMHDDESSVRAAAFEKLNEWGASGEEMKEVILSGLGDSSYMVQGEALLTQLEMDEEAALEKASEWEKVKNRDIQNAVWEVYATAGDSTKASYFESELRTRTGFSRYYLMYFYGNYCGRMDKEIAMRGMNTITEVGQSVDGWWGTYGAQGAIKRVKSGFEYQKQKLQAELKDLEKFNVTRELEIKNELDDIELVLAEADAKLEMIENEASHP